MTVIFRKSRIDKEKLRQIILKNPQSLLAGLSFIDLQLSTDEAGVIDFLGVDTNGRIVLVNFDAAENDQMLLEMLSQMQWLKKNEGLIKRLFFSESVDFEQSPQMLLVAPGFSPKMLSAVRQIAHKSIKLLQYNYLLSPEDDAIIFDEVYSNFFPEETSRTVPAADIVKPEKIKPRETVTAAEPAPVKQPEKTVQKKKADLGLGMVSLTPEEIAEFMNFELPQEQNQISE